MSFGISHKRIQQIRRPLIIHIIINDQMPYNFIFRRILHLMDIY